MKPLHCLDDLRNYRSDPHQKLELFYCQSKFDLNPSEYMETEKQKDGEQKDKQPYTLISELSNGKEDSPIMKELSELDMVREVGQVIPDLNFSSVFHRNL